MTPAEKILKKLGLAEPAPAAASKHEDESPENHRRSFLKKSVLGGVAFGGATLLTPIEDLVAQSTQTVSRYGAPSDLKITDMRYAVTTVLGRTAIIRIDTNQGIYGLGEVRDGADERYALMLKSRLMGMNPCNVEQLFKAIRQFGGPSRQAGGVCGVEMALWDIVGKAYNVPAWQLLGGRYRDKIRLYADTPESGSPEEQKKLIDYRLNEQGYTWLKMDLGIGEIKAADGLVNRKFWENERGALQQWGDQSNYMNYGNTRHSFTQIQITDKGLDELAELVAAVRGMVGYQTPLSTDHYGHFDLNNGIRLGKKLEQFRLAWMEDVVPWDMTDQWKTLSDALETPMLTGEDIYLLKDFKPLIDSHAVDIIHPDLSSSGGLLETKRIGDYAEEHGIAMAMHQAGTPVSFMANVHCAAATQNFLALEHHSIDLPWWESLVKTTDGRKLITKGYANLPLTAPGLGIELNDEAVKAHLHPSDKSYFAPTPQWNDRRSHDRVFS
jgi:L-alanine-DL-glutamate epimerase-like enolase superfamily enzyme